jgi:hypothetical protein
MPHLMHLDLAIRADLWDRSDFALQLHVEGLKRQPTSVHSADHDLNGMCNLERSCIPFVK